jgi:hypothetical protein
LKGHDFSRTANDAKFVRALAFEGMASVKLNLIRASLGFEKDSLKQSSSGECYSDTTPDQESED